MRSKKAFAYSGSTGYFCSVATDHPPCHRVTPRRAGACHDATGMERHDKDPVPTPTNGQQGKSPSSEAGARLKFDGSNNNGRPLSPQQRDF
jgi:hypothetical protein